MNSAICVILEEKKRLERCINVYTKYDPESNIKILLEKELGIINKMLDAVKDEIDIEEYMEIKERKQEDQEERVDYFK